VKRKGGSRQGPTGGGWSGLFIVYDHCIQGLGRLVRGHREIRGGEGPHTSYVPYLPPGHMYFPD
jgi:hypothetical protein